MNDSYDPAHRALRDSIAQTLLDTAVRLAREQAADIDPGNSRIKSVFEIAHRETDRGVSILVFALAEDLMAEGLKRNLNTKIRGGWEGAVEATGLLGTAANRITLLHMLDWIRPSTARDLLILKSIRNRFAHHADLNGFEDQKVRSWIANMTRADEALDSSPIRATLLSRSFTLREQYLIRACSIITRLAADLVVGPIARRHNADPDDVAGRDYDGMLPSLKETHTIIADVILMIARPPGSSSPST